MVCPPLLLCVHDALHREEDVCGRQMANLKKDNRVMAPGPVGILDRPLTKAKGEVSLSSFAFLFSEIVQYSQNRVASVADLERK
jgi:hypothetical protein